MDIDEIDSDKEKGIGDITKVLFPNNSGKGKGNGKKPGGLTRTPGSMPEYDRQWNFLSLSIDIIEEMIIMCKAPYDIITLLNLKWGMIDKEKPITIATFLKWCENSAYSDRLREAKKMQ